MKVRFSLSIVYHIYVEIQVLVMRQHARCSGEYSGGHRQYNQE